MNEPIDLFSAAQAATNRAKSADEQKIKSVGFDALAVPTGKPQTAADAIAWVTQVPPSKEKTRIVERSPLGYITCSSNLLQLIPTFSPNGPVDVAKVGNSTLFCRSSEDAIATHNKQIIYGQDAAAIAVIGDYSLLVDCDGVGQAYQGGLLAKRLTTHTVNNPSQQLYGVSQQDLAINFEQAIQHALGWELPTPNTGIPMVDESLRGLKEYGSETTFNQVLINRRTGEADGLFFGDGGFTIIRVDGTREDYDCGSNRSRISTNQSKMNKIREKMGKPDESDVKVRRMSDIVGHKVVLKKGDRVVMYSDGLQITTPDGKKKLNDEMAAVLVKEKTTDEEIVKAMDNIAITQGRLGDDLSLLSHTQP